MPVRKIQRKDVPELVRLVKEVYREYPQAMWFADEPGERDLELLFDRKLATIDAGDAVDFVYAEKGVIVAECEIVRLRGSLGVVGIIVRSDFRHKGIGGKLLERGIEEAKGIGLKALNAEVGMKNSAAIAFFERHGFRIVSPSDTEPAEHEGVMLFQRAI